MNTPEPSPMSSCHILIKRLHGIRPAHLSVLLVHVVRSTPRIISEPDAEVLDLERTFLMNLVQGDHFAGGLLQLAEFGQKVPEAGLGDHGVGCEDAHAVELGGRICFGRQAAAYHLVLLEATWRQRVLVVEVLPRCCSKSAQDVVKKASSLGYSRLHLFWICYDLFLRCSRLFSFSESAALSVLSLHAIPQS